MEAQWVIPLHLLIGVISALYGFIIPKNPFDYVYLILYYLTVTHWTFLNGECCISYYFKVKNDPTYIPGKDPNKNETEILFKAHENTINHAMFIRNLFVSVSLYLVFERCKIPKSISLSFIFLFLFYYVFKISTHEPYKNEIFLIVQEIIKYLLLLIGIVLFYRIYRRFNR